MDLQKYEEALDNISEETIDKYFNEDEEQYDFAKLRMLETFENKDAERLEIPTPFFIEYFKQNFSFLCQNAPEFVCSILRINAKEIKHSIKEYITEFPIFVKNIYFFTHSIKKISELKTLYQDFHKAINNTLDSQKIKVSDIEDCINLIEQFEKIRYYKPVRFAYLMLLRELKFSLLLLSNLNDMNKMCDVELDLVQEYHFALQALSEIDMKVYPKYTVLTAIIEDLRFIYSRIEENHTDPKSYKLVTPTIKETPKVSDSAINIKMNPFPGREKNNVITINNNKFDEVENSPFDFLYYLLWLQKNYPDKKAALANDGIIPSEHIKAITENDEQLSRFGYSWNDQYNIRFKNEKSKIVKKINKNILRKELNLNFDAIVPDGKYYKLTNRIKPGNIELVSFDTNI